MSKKTFKGKVISDKMTKTVVVAVELPKRHAVYGKIIKNTRKFKARNEMNAKLNSLVTIEECNPYSKDVCWIVTEVEEVKGK